MMCESHCYTPRFSQAIVARLPVLAYRLFELCDGGTLVARQTTAARALRANIQGLAPAHRKARSVNGEPAGASGKAVRTEWAVDDSTL